MSTLLLYQRSDSSKDLFLGVANFFVCKTKYGEAKRSNMRSAFSVMLDLLCSSVPISIYFYTHLVSKVREVGIITSKQEGEGILLHKTESLKFRADPLLGGRAYATPDMFWRFEGTSIPRCPDTLRDSFFGFFAVWFAMEAFAKSRWFDFSVGVLS